MFLMLTGLGLFFNSITLYVYRVCTVLYCYPSGLCATLCSVDSVKTAILASAEDAAVALVENPL